MEVEFPQYTEAGLAAFRRAVAQREWRKRVLWMSFAAAIAAGLPSLYFWARGLWPSLYGGWLATAALTIYIVVAIRMAITRLLANFQQKGGVICRARITPNEFYCENEFVWGRVAWTKIHDVATYDNHIMVFTDRAEAEIIPCSAFESPQQAERFAELAARYLADRNAGKFPPAEAVAVEDPAQRIRFPVLPEDRMAALQNLVEQKLPGEDGRAPKRSAASQSLLELLLGGLFVAGAIAFHFRPLEQMSTTRQVMHGAGGFLIFFFIAYFAGQRLRQWWGRLTANKAEAMATVTLTQDGLHFASADQEFLGRWTHWEDIRRTNSYFLFCVVKKFPALVIPQRAFMNPGLADLFFERAVNYWDSAQRESSIELPHARPHSDNPYDAPGTI